MSWQRPCVIVCITADSWPFHTSEWPLGIVYMDLDLVPSAIAVVPDRDVASHGVSLGMQSFTGYFNKMASIHFIKKKNKKQEPKCTTHSKSCVQNHIRAY